MFHSHSKDENGNLANSGTAALLQLDTLLSMQNYIQSVYYNAYLLILYFQMQFIKNHCTVGVKSAINVH